MIRLLLSFLSLLLFLLLTTCTTLQPPIYAHGKVFHNPQQLQAFPDPLTGSPVLTFTVDGVRYLCTTTACWSIPSPRSNA